MRTRSLAPLFAATALALGGCGGGGSANQAAKYNLLAGYTSLVTNGLTSSVTLGGNVVVNSVTTPFTGTGTLTMAPSTAASFNGTTGVSQTVGVTGTVVANGQSSGYGSSVTDYYSSGTLTFLGEETASEFDVAQSAFNYPTTLTTACSGTLGVLSRYVDSTMGVSLGTVQVSYACEAPATTGGPLSITFTSKIYDAGGLLAETDTTTYALSTNNAMTFVSATTRNASGNLSVTSP